VDAQEVSVHLDKILKQWCVSMRIFKDGIEKQQAYKGLCLVILQNPQGALPHFAYLCSALVQYKNPPSQLEIQFKAILQSYKQQIGQGWDDYLNEYPADLKNEMIQRFSL